ncbi:hypothetical protein HK104_009566 [Borealophlyctis nickersoniae]|nr:hypothetical protein HK104_009566 [Borealophlyctis nickersoniae]
MMRNLPSVRMAELQLKRGDLAVDKENIQTQFKTPSRKGLGDRGALLNSSFKTPAGKVFTGGHAPGKIHDPKSAMKTPALQIKNKNILNIKDDAPKTGGTKRLGLRELSHNTPRRDPDFGKKSTGGKNGGIQRLEKPGSAPKSKGRVSAKKTKKVTIQSPQMERKEESETQQSSGVSDANLEEDVPEPEYMPPSTFDEPYRPDHAVDFEVFEALAAPQLLTYVSPEILERAFNEDPPEFEPEPHGKDPLEDEAFAWAQIDLSPLQLDDDFSSAFMFDEFKIDFPTQ